MHASFHLGESGHEVERLRQLALRPVDGPAGAQVHQVEREYPEVDGEHHVGPRRLEAVVDAVLLGVGDAVKNQVHRNLGLCRVWVGVMVRDRVAFDERGIGTACL